MKKIILATAIILFLAEFCTADEISDQIKSTFKALEKVNSMSTTSIHEPQMFIQATTDAEAEANYLLNIRNNECTKKLFRSSFNYKTAAIYLSIERTDDFIKNSKAAYKLLKEAYNVCYPDKKIKNSDTKLKNKK